MPGNSSLIGLTSRLGYPEIGIWLALTLLVVTAILLFTRSRGVRVDEELIHAAGITLSLLASPISWAGYTIFTLPYFLSQKKWSIPIIIAAGILILPFNFNMHFYYNFGRFGFVFWGWWYGIALAICFTYILFKLWRPDAYTKRLERQQ
jgi:hypothetical protein